MANKKATKAQSKSPACQNCHKPLGIHLGVTQRCPVCIPGYSITWFTAEPDEGCVMTGKAIPLTDKPCRRCLELAQAGKIRPETIQRLPVGAFAPRAKIGNEKICPDCASAEGLVARDMGMTFEMARVAVGNDRQEQYRLPGAPMGLVRQGFVRPSQPGDLEDQHAWLDKNGWFNCDQEERGVMAKPRRISSDGESLETTLSVRVPALIGRIDRVLGMKKVKQHTKYFHRGLAGCVQQTKSRVTGTLVGVYHGSQSGMEIDPATPWVTVCEEHNNLVGHQSLMLARSWAPKPDMWCEDCQKLVEEKSAK